MFVIVPSDGRKFIHVAPGGSESHIVKVYFRVKSERDGGHSRAWLPLMILNWNFYQLPCEEELTIM